jgi:DNA repair exonuclease SbcCD ATPase subunit
MAQLAVVPLNFRAMKSLLTENRRLRDQLESEKSALSSVIADLKAHLQMSEHLVCSNRIPSELHRQFLSISSTLDLSVLKPRLAFRTTASSQPSDLTEQLRAKQSEYDTVQSEVLDLAQQRTALALEEQRLNGTRSSHLQEAAAARRDCDDLVALKEKLEREVADLEALVEFWRERNAKSEVALREAMDELGALRQEKDSQSLQLLQELQAMYATLDDASHFLPK